MSLRRAIRTVIALYPRRWRERYGLELENLTRDAIDHGDSSPTRVLLNLARGAGTQRLLALRAHPATATAPVAAAIVFGAILVTAGLGHPANGRGPTKQPTVSTTHGAPAPQRRAAYPQLRPTGSITVTIDPATGAVFSIQGAPTRVILDPRTGETLSVRRSS